MKKAIKTASAVLALAGIAGTSIAPAVMAWGDNSGNANGRQTYTLTNCTANYDKCNIEPALGNKITFNSITNNPEIGGDERNFVGARENTGVNSGKGNTWNANEITVENGKEYLVRLYAHNNNPNGTNGVAKDVTLHFTLPTQAGTSLSVQGSIDSSNATPTRVYDDVVFKSADGRAFYLDYIEGSALYENNGIGANGGIQLSDNIITSNGAKIGYSSLNGEIPGCFQYDSYTTIRVKAVYLDESYTVEKTVRNVTNEEKSFSDTTNANVGDIVEYQILYKNDSSENVENVIVKDILPNNMEYIAGTTKLYNASNPSGIINTNDTITTTGINIGGYAAGANAYIRFRAKVVDKSMACGTNKLVNWGQVGVGQTTLQDNAFVMVNKTEGCDVKPDPEPTPDPVPDDPTPTPVTPSEMPTTGAGSIAAGVVGAGSVVTAAGYYIASRKSLRR
ncbi:DUF11 domain-containing protein [Candidatus Saccharibacteria bacterium]|nr:DUF11 domain-containing protein [Candidatus Saccharibacteria bacterium]